MANYDFETIENKWANKWINDKLYSVTEDPNKPKYFAVGMLPYPSGKLHMGHALVYSIVDSKARLKRMQGFNVLNPIGWDAFGLPAENAAIKHGINPATWTHQNIESGREQLKRLGFSFDWTREITSCEPDYYRWTQWFFLLMYKNNLAERREGWVNWCPSCNTVLANEQVESDGSCWRCSTTVTRKRLTQWFFKITEFADELWNDLDELSSWPYPALAIQRNWIGKSEGMEIKFKIKENDQEISVYTTRPDTLFGATFIAVSPEHDLVSALVNKNPSSDLAKYVKDVLNRSELDRLQKETKLGMYLGLNAVNPLTQESVPVWVADYVVSEYGLGAVMGVPAHDARDMQFARQYNLSIKTVINNPDQTTNLLTNDAYDGDGEMINSGEFNGMSNTQAQIAIKNKIISNGFGVPNIRFKLRDWLISRQRYWGCPIPIVYCDKCGIVPVPEEYLPVLLPDDVEFLGASGNVLEQSQNFVHTKCPKCSGPAKRETDTMDTFMCSSWYIFRYLDPHNETQPFGLEKAKYWMPMDFYVGLVEHAGCHMIYYRFFVKMLHKQGLLPIDINEPVYNFFNNGIMKMDGHKMSKSRGNVVIPDDMVNKYGADALRLYILSDSPPDQDIEWNDASIRGINKYINSLWATFQQVKDIIVVPDPSELGGLDWSDSEYGLRNLLHATIKKVEEDIMGNRHNTAITAIRILTNSWQDYVRSLKLSAVTEKQKKLLSELTINIILLLAPLTYFLSEEMWSQLGNKTSVHKQAWPIYKLLQEQRIEIVVQINGRKRKVINVSPDSTEDTIRELVLNDFELQKEIKDRKIGKVIFVPKRLINIVLT